MDHLGRAGGRAGAGVKVYPESRAVLLSARVPREELRERNVRAPVNDGLAGIASSDQVPLFPEIVLVGGLFRETFGGRTASREFYPVAIVWLARLDIPGRSWGGPRAGVVALHERHAVRAGSVVPRKQFGERDVRGPVHNSLAGVIIFDAGPLSDQFISGERASSVVGGLRRDGRREGGREGGRGRYSIAIGCLTCLDWPLG